VKPYLPFTILCLLFLGCAGSPTTVISPYSWDAPYWKTENYQKRAPNSVMVTEGDLVKDYKEVARIHTEGRPKNKEEAYSLMRRRVAEFGADAVIKVRQKKNKNSEGIVVLFE
jgi:hypothetical protein